MICPKCGKGMHEVFNGDEIKRWKCMCSDDIYEQQVLESAMYFGALKRHVNELKKFLLDFKNDVPKEYFDKFSDLANTIQIIVNHADERSREWIGIKNNPR